MLVTYWFYIIDHVTNWFNHRSDLDPIRDIFKGFFSCFFLHLSCNLTEDDDDFQHIKKREKLCCVTGNEAAAARQQLRRCASVVCRETRCIFNRSRRRWNIKKIQDSFWSKKKKVQTRLYVLKTALRRIIVFLKPAEKFQNAAARDNNTFFKTIIDRNVQLYVCGGQGFQIHPDPREE